MEKKFKWNIFSVITLFIVALPFGFLYVLNNGNPYTEFIANKKVPKYLEEMGYKESDIEVAQYVEPKHLINRDYYQGHYMVIFKDEPNITYYYGITKYGKQVNQFCEKEKLFSYGSTNTIEFATKHSESKCIKSLDNRD